VSNNKTRKSNLFVSPNVKCVFCGKMVPDEGYRVVEKGKEQLYCSEECYNFSKEYKKFREGDKI
jgi:predicted nucleic acid-binding Zn ribbon protein